MLKIMFVDDEKLALENIQTLLPWQEMDRCILTCDNALDAIDRMIEEKPDILIVDIRMPVVDGLELVSRAKEMYPSLKCLVLSAYGEFELAQMAIERKVQGYLLKPCSKEELEQAIRKCEDEIRQEAQAASACFDQRGKKIKQIYDALTAMQADAGGLITAKQLQEITQRYGDFTLLREAALSLMMEYETAIPELRPIIRQMSQFSCDEESVLRLSAAALQAICRSVGENGGIVDAVLRYVNDNYVVESLTLQYVADHVLHLNAKYLGRCFLKQKGMKFGDYLLHVRMERALALINDDKKLNAAAIAAQVGLGNNVQYFYRLFKQYTGYTLNSYRSQLKE